ncbi:MAG: hypothetical protein JWM10_646 [Myxococcaceae bacterium]|nr:hypothetical protein [Myxococcaceae bacterium]
MLLYAGARQDEALVHHGPFVAGSRDEIARLFDAYRRGGFQRRTALSPEARASREAPTGTPGAQRRAMQRAIFMGASRARRRRVLADAALWLVFLAGCAGRPPRPAAQSVTTRRPPVATYASTEAARAPAPESARSTPGVASAPAPPVAPATCTATLRAAFHLRPHMTVRSIGPEVAAGSRVVVLGTSNVSRSWQSDTTPVLSRVRVIATGAEGYAFVHPRELGPECPLLPDRDRTPSPIRDRIGGRHPDYLLRHTSTPTTTWNWPFDPADDEVLARFDIDHNGNLETLVRAQPRDGRHTAVVLLREGVRGPVGIVVAEYLDEGENFSARFGTTIVAGGVVYLAMEESATGGCRHCRDASCGSNAYALYRLHPDGWFVHVGWVPLESQGEGLRVRGEDDGTLTVEGQATHRRVSLRFDRAAFWFVTDAPTLPENDGEGGEDFCTRD